MARHDNGGKKIISTALGLHLVALVASASEGRPGLAARTAAQAAPGAKSTAASAERPLVRRVPTPKPAHTAAYDGLSRHVIQVKFVEGSMVRLRAAEFATVGTDD